MKLPRRLLPGEAPTPLFDAASSRIVERAALAAAASHVLIERAGFAVARLALALAPQAERIWVAAGPGNNGGDGLVAARWLHRAGKAVHVTWEGDPQRLPADAAHAREEALQAGLTLHSPKHLPDFGAATPDLMIDALLGFGQQREPRGTMASSIAAMNECRRSGGMLLAVDVPTGLCSDTGRLLGHAAVQAHATLSLLTAKPGLFTADGRDASGDIWWDDLGVQPDALPSARLAGGRDAHAALAPRRHAAHASHKGRFGDVWAVGGANGMGGAIELAARAGLRAGAGRVYVSALRDEAGSICSPAFPELMQRRWVDGLAQGLADHATVVCGCGGGDAVRHALPPLLSRTRRLVLDADALNAIAADPALAGALQARSRRGMATVMTPHPLEAARLLGITAAELQHDRLGEAQRLAERFGAVVLLKGSGSVIAAPGALPIVNPTGNSRLATAGSGDVLAGWLGGCWSTHESGDVSCAIDVTAGSAWLHGRAADAQEGTAGLPRPASALIETMATIAETLP
jgi:hydroxyethylthiazole kinase-like uncharacterized protein yjeF